MIWMLVVLVVLGLSGAVGAHLGRFRDTYNEMTGMMAGMTMGMLNGFILGYAIGAATVNMFWGNLFGILFGLTLGVYFGRGGGLMGGMDGAMGGVMGGSMGAMLALMVQFPNWAQVWTAVLLGAIYIAGMIALVVLIEGRAPEHTHLHRLAPLFVRNRAGAAVSVAAPGLINYYEMLDIPVKAPVRQIALAYAAFAADTDAAGRAVADVALATLTSPERRARYDRELAVAAGRGECCPPPRRSSAAESIRGAATGAHSRRAQETGAHGQH
jgi:hypothetical protein